MSETRCLLPNIHRFTHSYNTPIMKGIKQFPLILFLLALCSFSAAAQSVSAISINPNQYNSNSLLTATVQGALPNPCIIINSSVSIQGNYVNLYLAFTPQPGVCNQVVTPFTQNIIIGTLPIGNYILRCYNANTGVQIFANLLFTVTSGSVGCQAPTASCLFANNITFNSIRINCNLSGVTYYQFIYRRVGYTTWYATSASSQNYWNMTGLLNNTNYEYCCRVYCNGSWTVYSPSQYCSTQGQPTGSNCSNAIVLTCGVTYSGSNNTGSYTYSNYSFPNGSQFTNMTGSESFHTFTVTSTSNVTINFSSLSQHLYLFLLSNCNTNCNTTSGMAYSCYTGNNNQQMTMNNLAPGTYTLIVDGWNGASCNYNLTVNCTALITCNAPIASQCYATNMTSNSCRLNCSTPGSYYDWSYRAPGGNWIEVPSSSLNYVDIVGLLPGVTYQFVVAVRCNNYWSYWSPICYCTTLPGTPYNCSNAIPVTCGNSYTGNNATCGYNYSSYTYNGQTTVESGPEAVYKLTVAANTVFTINLSGLSSDLDLFLLNSCNGNNAVVAESGHSGTTNESLTMTNLPAGTYYIVVDGWNGYISNFLLSIVCANNSYCSNDEPCSAQILSCYNSCIWTSTSNTGSTMTTTPSSVGGCNSTGMQDVWYAVQIPATGRMRVTTGAGTMTNGVMGIYGGSSCAYLNCYGCVDNANGSLMPDIIITGSAGIWIYLRVWGYGGSVGSFSICVTILQGSTSLQANDVPTFDLNTDMLSDRDDTKKVEARTETGGFSLQIFPVPTQDEVNFSAQLPVDKEADIRVFDLNGRLVKEMHGLQSVQGTLLERMQVGELPVGLYIVKVRSGEVELSSKFSKI